MVLFILGRSAQPAMQKKVHFYSIYVANLQLLMVVLDVTESDDKVVS